ncbi:MAG: histidine kinase [Bacteroidia bacterium]|nr:histidine kinase [Bacteroidia bacterium]
MRPFIILVYFSIFLRGVVIAQQHNGPAAKFTFNKGQATEEISGRNAKTGSVLFVNDRFGNPKSACYLHGSPGSYLNLGTDKSLKPDIGTIALWIKIDVAMQGGQGYQFNPIVLTKNNNGEDFNEAYAIAYDYVSKKVVVATSLSEKLQVQLYTGDTLNLSKWHHVAMAFNNDTLAFYLDGELNSKIQKNFRTEYLQTDSVLIGSTGSKKNERYLCANVDDINIYNRVLSADEITELYNQPDHNRFNSYLKWGAMFSAIAALVALLVWFFVRRYKYKLKQIEAYNRVKTRMAELETRAIRMQMNPHFMFNSLNTLQRFILESDFNKAHDYLAMFSKLLRRLIESSDSESISLEEEMEILKAFVDIEKLRFGNSFEFSITNSVPEPGKIKIPFMLIQPLLENAIWHGLLPKSGEKKLSVTFDVLDEKRLICRVDDNGVGRQKSAKQKDPIKKRSLALEFIKQRLEIHEKITGLKNSLQIIDKHNTAGASEGTLVEIIIPIMK